MVRARAWTDKEVRLLRAGVEKHGQGKAAARLIAASPKFNPAGRTANAIEKKLYYDSDAGKVRRVEAGPSGRLLAPCPGFPLSSSSAPAALSSSSAPCCPCRPLALACALRRALP